MSKVIQTGRYDHYILLGSKGLADDVDGLMNALVESSDLASTRLVDYALGLVDTVEGRARIRHYLFEGTQQQRNYAALYFKRRNVTHYLEEAVAAGRIDAVQAFSR
jgi:hypothetical protein